MRFAAAICLPLDPADEDGWDPLDLRGGIGGAQYRNAFAQLVNRAPAPQSPGNAIPETSEAVKQKTEGFAGIVADKSGVKYEDMLRPGSDKALVTSAFLVACMMCKLSRPEAPSTRVDLRLLCVTMCHTYHFVEGPISDDARSL